MPFSLLSLYSGEPIIIDNKDVLNLKLMLKLTPTFKDLGGELVVVGAEVDVRSLL